MDARVLKMQIGIGVLMSVGARDFKLRGETLTFRVGTKRQAAMLSITLTPNDTYNVRYVSMGKGAATVEEVDDVYCDNIADVVRRLGDRA